MNALNIRKHRSRIFQRPCQRVRCKGIVQCSLPGNTEAASSRRPLVVATRTSRLAQEQTRQVQQLLLAAAQLRNETLQLSTLELSTKGDISSTASLRSLGSGAFTEVLDAAVADGRADLAVHSLKDCPATLQEGLVLAACLPRADPRDALISHEGKGLGELTPGSRVGTSSSRRAAQIQHAFPHLQVVPLRGNVEARLESIKAGEVSATVMALAGLQRLGYEEMATTVLSLDEMLPAACQGAVGVVCRKDDPWVLRQLSAISYRPTLLEVSAERACLAALLGSPEAGRGGQAFPDIAWGCNSRHNSDRGTSDLDVFVSDLQGKELFRYSEFQRPVSGVAEAEALGTTYGTILRMVAEQKGWLLAGQQQV